MVLMKKRDMHDDYVHACLRNGGRITEAGYVEHGCLHYDCEGKYNNFTLEVCPKGKKYEK